MAERADRAAVQSQNVARHLNADHPDTVLFLARCVPGHEDVTGAELVDIEEVGLVLRVTGSPRDVSLPFPPTQDSLDLRARIASVLRASRVDHPGALTSLEQRLEHQRHGHSHSQP